MIDDIICQNRKLLLEHIRTRHLKRIFDSDGPVFYISDTYAGVWLEHCLDAVIWSEMCGSAEIAENQLGLFIKHQKPDGQLPFMVSEGGPGYSHLQECVSFGSLCLDTYRLNHDKQFLLKCRESVKKWVKWLEVNRMPSGKGLVEAFCGYDTGHDNSPRHNGFKYPKAVCGDASALPAGCEVLPGIFPDINAVYYGNLRALSDMEALSGNSGESEKYDAKAREVRRRIHEICFCNEDCFFYDVDKHGKMRKLKTAAITNVLYENVPDEALSGQIITKYILNEREFKTPYPFPAVSVSEPLWIKNTQGNSWGYYSQALTALRATRWMKRTGRNDELKDAVCQWVKAANNAPEHTFGQELDPFTGEFSSASPWYSSCMLLYLSATDEMNGSLSCFDE